MYAMLENYKNNYISTTAFIFQSIDVYNYILLNLTYCIYVHHEQKYTTFVEKITISVILHVFLFFSLNNKRPKNDKVFSDVFLLESE